MLNLLDFITQYKVLNGYLNIIYGLEMYKSEFAYGIKNERFNIVMASRQIGMTTMLKSTAAYYLLNNYNVLYVDKFIQNGYRFVEDVNLITQYHKTVLDDAGFGNSLVIKNSKEKLIVNENNLRSCNNNIQLRGYNLKNTVIIFDDASYINNLDNFIRDIIITNPHKIILVGCNQPDDNHFNSIYHRNNNLWNKITIPYTSCSRLINKKDEIINSMGEQVFNKMYRLT